MTVASPVQVAVYRNQVFGLLMHSPGPSNVAFEVSKGRFTTLPIVRALAQSSLEGGGPGSP